MGLLVGALLTLVYGLHLLDRPEYDPNLNVAFVGTKDDADCIVLWQKDFAMMIDTGETVFKVHSTVMQPQGSRVGINIVPFNIHIMKPMPKEAPKDV